jgi:hypothetical protein
MVGEAGTKSRRVEQERGKGFDNQLMSGLKKSKIGTQVLVGAMIMVK